MASPVIETIATVEESVNATSRTIAKPSGTVSGNWLVLVVAVDGSTAVTQPTGFNTVYSVTRATVSLGIFKRKADGSEGATFTIATASEQVSACIMRISGGDATDIVDVLSDYVGAPATNAEIFTPVAYAECPDSLILRICAADTGTLVFTSTSGTTDVTNSLGNNSGGATLSITREDQAAAGYTALKFFDSSTANEESFGLTLVLRSTSTPSAYPDQPVIRCMSVSAPISASEVLTYEKPYGTVDDDLLVLIQSADANAHLTPPGTFTVIQDSSNSAIWHQAYYRVASSEGTSYTGSVTGAATTIGLLLRVVNADTSAPINQSSVATGTSASPDASTITPSVNNCLLLYTEANDDDDVTFNSGYPTGYTGLLALNDPVSSDAGSIIAFNTQTTAGATGTVSGTLAASEEWVALNIAIAPASVAAPGFGGFNRYYNAHIGGMN